ncbi:hypothetical protein [Streptomyces sp. NRRL S-237]|uniref:hypothetical protein n=1 Tax=Streptomyces sp. NRRL S-237 TaxID=1463895 RepID=UPI0004C6B42D|nr:hypothetical protein [Streptomyces sp. NRRL S-237]
MPTRGTGPGRRIQAIKRYRATTGTGLKEAKSRWQDSDGSDQWATEDETRDQIIAFYRRTWEHSDATIDE